MHLCEISDDPGWQPRCKAPASRSIKLTDHHGVVKVVWLCDYHYSKELELSYFQEIWEHVEY